MIKQRPKTKIISASRATPPTGRHLIGPPVEEEHTSCQPTVELQRVDQKIVGIEVTCSCGEKLFIECQYEEQ